MATGSIKPVKKLAFKYADELGLVIPLTNGFAGKLYAGQEVFISADNTIDKRVDGTSDPLGVLAFDVEQDEKAEVALQRSGINELAVIKATAVTAGQAVVPNGNVIVDADGAATGFEYVVATTGQKYQAVALTGASADGQFRAVILKSAQTLP